MSSNLILSLMFKTHIREYKFLFFTSLQSIFWIGIILLVFLPDLILLTHYNFVCSSFEEAICDLIYFLIISSLYLNLPLIILQNYLFLLSSLLKIEKYKIRIIILETITLWFLGVLFIPQLFMYLPCFDLNFNNETILFLPTLLDTMKFINEIIIVWILLIIISIFVYFEINRWLFWVLITTISLLFIEPFSYLFIFIILFCNIELNILFYLMIKKISGQRDSNPHPIDSKSKTLPLMLKPRLITIR